MLLFSLAGLFVDWPYFFSLVLFAVVNRLYCHTMHLIHKCQYNINLIIREHFFFLWFIIKNANVLDTLSMKKCYSFTQNYWKCIRCKCVWSVSFQIPSVCACVRSSQISISFDFNVMQLMKRHTWILLCPMETIAISFVSYHICLFFALFLQRLSHLCMCVH